MPIVWNDSLSTGIITIDNQHKELFKRINELLDSSGKTKETINEVARFLQSYIINHFATEEHYMNRTKYPDYPAHKSAHDRYREEFNQLKEKIEKEGVGLSVSVQMNHLLIDWWLNHINKVDKKMADFIKDKI